VINYVDDACKLWGEEKAKIYGRLFDAHIRGAWRNVTMIAQLRSEARSFAAGTPVQWFPEVYKGDALLVRRALEGIGIDLYIVCLVHYAMKGNTRTKVKEAGELLEKDISTRAYWELLDRAHHWIGGRMSALVAVKPKSPDAVCTSEVV
jgi:hypothetical protein